MNGRVSRRAFVLRSLSATGSLLLSPRGLWAAPWEMGAEADRRLWYPDPAGEWTEALPVGNGRLGAMVFGGVQRERLQLNEDTLWSGGPKDWNNPQARRLLPEIRRLIADGRFEEADQLSKGMMGPYTQSYLPMGNFHLAFRHGEAYQDYHRDLDLGSAVAGVSYRIDDIRYTREVFASHPDQVLVVRLAADRPGALSFSATLDSPLRFTTAAQDEVLRLAGRAPAHVDPNYYDRPNPVIYNNEGGMSFAVHLGARSTGGRM